jgi:hypothetical protein
MAECPLLGVKRTLTNRRSPQGGVKQNVRPALTERPLSFILLNVQIFKGGLQIRMSAIGGKADIAVDGQNVR